MSLPATHDLVPTTRDFAPTTHDFVPTTHAHASVLVTPVLVNDFE